MKAIRFLAMVVAAPVVVIALPFLFYADRKKKEEECWSLAHAQRMASLLVPHISSPLPVGEILISPEGGVSNRRGSRV